MFSICSIPLSGVWLSCMLLTEPFDVTVVVMPHIADAADPIRISLPSMLPISCRISIAAICLLPPISWSTDTAIPTT